MHRIRRTPGPQHRRALHRCIPRPATTTTKLLSWATAPCMMSLHSPALPELYVRLTWSCSGWRPNGETVVTGRPRSRVYTLVSPPSHRLASMPRSVIKQQQHRQQHHRQQQQHQQHQQQQQQTTPPRRPAWSTGPCYPTNQTPCRATV